MASPHPNLNVPVNTAKDLGVYPSGDPCGRQTISDFSRFTYCDSLHQMMMFGGGHAATPRTDVDVLDLNPSSSLVWTPAYASTALADMNAGNLDSTNARWINTNHPLSRHTYDSFIWAPNVARMVLITITTDNPPNCVSANAGSSGRIAHYNPVAKTWSFTATQALNFARQSEYDPPSGKIITVMADGLWIYDPVTFASTKVVSFSLGLGFANNLVYFPPNQKHYVISRGSPTTVWEVTLNRTTFGSSTVVQVSGISGAGPSGGTETGYAYDSTNQLIGGGVLNGVFYTYNPVSKVWLTKTMVPQPTGLTVGSVAFHCLDYDPVNNVYIFLTNSASGRRTWAYKWATTSGGDTSPPTAPGGLQGSAASSTQVNLSWNASSDNVGVTGYRVFRNSQLAATVPTTSHIDTGLTPSTTYTYNVAAQDAAGNQSSLSNTINVTTQGQQDTQAPIVSITFPANGATVAGGVNITANASDDIGVVGVQFKINGTNQGAEDTTAPYSAFWDTTSVPNGSRSITATARDASGKSTTSSTVNVTVNNTGIPVNNSITIIETSGSTQTNRPISIGRVFSQGNIPNYAQAVISGSGVLTQCDVKNRWPDNSLKFAILSFIISSLPANGTITVSFQNQGTGNNTGFLDQTGMLAVGFNFDGQIQMTGANVQTVSARTMLNAGLWRYWLQGPVCTAIIIEDRSTARSQDKDFGDNSKALHPIFEAWFYPQGNRVELGYCVENCWSSSTVSVGMRDVTYSLILRSGLNSPVTELTHASFNHVGKSRWHKHYWLGTDPGSVNINFNRAYMAQTRALPAYDTSLTVAESVIASQYQLWVSADKTIDGDTDSIGNYDKFLDGAGAAHWIGLLSTWETVYLMTYDARMYEKMIGNADLAGRFQVHYREADTLAGTGDFFDAPFSGNVNTFGRVISVNARRTVTLRSLSDTCGSAYVGDEIHTGTIVNETAPITRSHLPEPAYLPYLLTGKFYYMEELMYWAAYCVGNRNGCYGGNFSRQGDAGYFNDSQVRGDAWGFRTTAYAAFITPDGMPEKTYFTDKLNNNIAMYEGVHNLTLSLPAKQSHWDWGRNIRSTNVLAPPVTVSPLGAWTNQGGGFVQEPLRQDGFLSGASSPWEENFLCCSMGMAKQFGFATHALLAYFARQRHNQLLNPQALKYLIEQFRYPTIIASTQNWVQTWPQFISCYSPVPSAWDVPTGFNTTDHGYGFIALAAQSFLTDQNVGSLTGQSAWNLFKQEKVGQNLFATESPKWDILPSTATPPPPPDTTPPAAPTGLRVT